VANRRNLFAITLPPPWGSLIDSDSLDAAEVGLDSIPESDWPPILIPFFTFRIMVGCGVLMLALAWVGTYLSRNGRLARNRPMLWLTFLSFPLPFIATLTGWFTAEVGRQPWVVYGVLRTADAMTPFLTTGAATISLIVYCAIYTFIFAFGIYYLYRLLRAGPVRLGMPPPSAAAPSPPLWAVDESDSAGALRVPSGE
jgi:cytochrome d ubiquinol oxidase subunit I